MGKEKGKIQEKELERGASEIDNEMVGLSAIRPKKKRKRSNPKTECVYVLPEGTCDSSNSGQPSGKRQGVMRLSTGKGGGNADGTQRSKQRRGAQPYLLRPHDKFTTKRLNANRGCFVMSKPSEKRENDPADSRDLGPLLMGSSAASPPAKFLDKMRARLSGGRFRMLNETLYTCRGAEAYQLFERDPTAFSVYHNGYQEQLSRWPTLPVDLVISWLRSRSPKLAVADFGCGDARLAKSVKNKVFSLDLMSTDPSVISCNMAHTPLDSGSVDVAVFCLSLMGTDYPSFLREAERVLKTGGALVIAEVKSRFDAENGGASPLQFIAALQVLGFHLVSQDASNKMFIMFYLQKEEGEAKALAKSGKERSVQWPQLKACIYKRR